MSNAYNDWKKDMEAYTKFFKRGDKAFKGICYNNDYCTDGMNYEFCDLLLDDVVVHKQINFNLVDPNVAFLIRNEETNEIETYKQTEDGMKVIIVQVGTSSRNPDGTYDEHYEKTLYVFHNDWLMSDGKDLFVVDEHHINEWKEISEKEYKSLTK